MTRTANILALIATLTPLIVSPSLAQALTINNHSKFEMSVTVTPEQGEVQTIAMLASSEVSLMLGSNLRVQVETVGGRGHWSHEVLADNLDTVIINAQSLSSTPGRVHRPRNLTVRVQSSNTKKSLAVQSIEAVEAVLIGRDIQFLGTADPQIAYSSNCATPGSTCYKHNDVADDTMSVLRTQLSLNPDLRGAVIAGDLTQNTWAKEFCRYVQSTGGIATFDDCDDDILGCIIGVNASNCDASNGPFTKAPFFYDGMGNHDYEQNPLSTNGTMSGEIRDWVHRSRDAAIFKLTTLGWIPHYSWNWDDVHFVQLNLYPGHDGLVSCSNDRKFCNPAGSLEFLEFDLAVNTAFDTPIVIIQHYGPDGVGGNETWPEDDAVTFWNSIKQYNVVAILNGHTNRAPNNCHARYDFDQPSGAANRPDGRTRIPAIEVGSAKGSGGSRGAYTYITMNAAHQIEIERRENDQTLQGIPRHSWCLPIDSAFYLDPSSSSGTSATGTTALPFNAFDPAISAMANFDRSCSVDPTIPATSCTTSTIQLDVPTLYLAEPTLTGPRTFATPMTIRQWN